MKFLLFLLMTFVPPIFIYLMVMFATWGEYWNPGSWDVSTRGLSAVIFTGWMFTIFMAMINTH